MRFDITSIITQLYECIRQVFRPLYYKPILLYLSLLENYGIRKLKEQFVYQIAGRILLSETLQYMQQELVVNLVMSLS